MSTPQSDITQIREALNMAFDDPALSAFCLDCFPRVYDRFSLGMPKDSKITLLLEHCRRLPSGFKILLNSVHQAYKMSHLPREELSPLIDTLEAYTGPSGQNLRPSQLMTPSGIPKPPQPYFAHPYPLQANFTGRVVEREMLSDWLTNDQRPVLALVAIGGMGKSSLSWYWLQVDVNHSRLSGIFWWSFYESEASFSRFLTEAIIYVSAGEVDPTTLTSNDQKVQMLVTLLQQQRILLVLDGFERLLRAYASMSAVYQRDETASKTAEARACVDPHMARLLRHLVAGPTQAKVLLTTRLMVHDLEDSIGFPLAGCRKEELNALHPDDAVTFMQVQGVTKGTAAEIKAACQAVGYHPLSLRLLSGLIARHRRQPGDIAAAPRHDIQANLVARRHHVLEAAVNALPEKLQHLLSRMAAFRNPISADALAIFNEFGANVSAKSNQESETKLLPIWARIKSIFSPKTPPSRLESGTEIKSSQQIEKACTEKRGDEEKFEAALEELLVRGLVFWDEQRRFYDLHPIVRAYAYDRLNNPVETHKRLRDYFAAIPTPHHSHIQSVDDLAVVTSLYYHTVRAGYPDEAWRLYDSRLRRPLYYHLGAYKDDILLLSELQGTESIVPRLQDIKAQTWSLLYLSMDYERTGQLQHALECAQQAVELNRHDGSVTDLGSSLVALASVNQNLGQLRFASENNLSSIKIFDQAGDPNWVGISHRNYAHVLIACGAWQNANQQLKIAEEVYMIAPKRFTHGLARLWLYRSLLLQQQGHLEPALHAVHQADHFAKLGHYVREMAYVYLQLGSIQDTTGQLVEAEASFEEALKNCRRMNLADLEPNILLGLAMVRSRTLSYGSKRTNEVNRLLGEALKLANRYQYRLKQADIHNVLAQIERDAGNNDAAIEAATQAYCFAWCDGPPHAYHWGLQKAKAHLTALGAPFPMKSDA